VVAQAAIAKVPATAVSKSLFMVVSLGKLFLINKGKFARLIAPYVLISAPYYGLWHSAKFSFNHDLSIMKERNKNTYFMALSSPL
jgi:hypothetical protein